MSTDHIESAKGVSSDKAAKRAAKAAKKAAKAAVVTSTIEVPESSAPSTLLPISTTASAKPPASTNPIPSTPNEPATKSKKRKAANDGPIPGVSHFVMSGMDVTETGDERLGSERAGKGPAGSESVGVDGASSDKRESKKRRKDKTATIAGDGMAGTSQVMEDVHPDAVTPGAPVPSNPSTSAQNASPAAPTTSDPILKPDPTKGIDETTARRAAKQAKREKKAKNRLDAAQAVPEEFVAIGVDAGDVKTAHGAESGEVKSVGAGAVVQVEAEKAAAPRSGDPEDPVGDERLSEKAGECLLYAYTYKTSFPTWKFSKPKQNWLQKHVYDGEFVPEEYVELVIAYLDTIQGNGKKHIIAEAKKVQAASITSEAEPEVPNPVTMEAPPVEEGEGEGGGVDGAATAAIPVVAPASANNADQEKAKAKARAERASRVLAVLDAIAGV